MPKPRAASQRDIALAAGVSQATVSFVLNGRADELGIQQATQDRILLAMEKLKYVPNAAARSLRGGRNNLIGVHTFEQVFPVHANDYYRAFLTGVEEQATESGLDLVLFASTQRPDGTRTIYGNGTNRLRLADGTVILGFKKDDDELAQLAAEGYPFVFIGRRDIPDVEIAYVSADYYSATRATVQLIASKGHDRVVYVGAVVRGSAMDERLAGYRDEWREVSDGEPRIEFVSPDDITPVWVAGHLAAGTTLLVAEGTDLTLAIIEAIAASGLSMPADISLVSLDGGSIDNGDISCMGIPRHEMGRRAVTLLLDVITGDAGASASVVLECTLPSTATIKDLGSGHPELSASHTVVSAKAP